MNVIVNISLRNLFRQKRRNILLGTAIAFGMMILIIAHSFSSGITDILLNKIVVWVAGHISVSFNEKGRLLSTIFRDRERILNLVKQNVEGILDIDEGMGTFCRTIGNNKSDNIVLVGIDTTVQASAETEKAANEAFKLVAGKFEDLNSTAIENPVIISEQKAKFLNLKLNDVVRLRYSNIFGNTQASRATITGLMSNENVFMQGVMFIELRNMKQMMGIRPYEVANINITIKNARKNAKLYADKLHSALKPGLAVIWGKVQAKVPVQNVTILGFKSDETSIKSVKEKVQIVDGSIDKSFAKDGVLVSKSLAEKGRIKPGDSFEFTYKNKFENKETTVKFTVTSLFTNPDLNHDIILVNEQKFYDIYYPNFPQEYNNNLPLIVPSPQSSIYPVLTTEWILLNRISSTSELRKRAKEISKNKMYATTIDVRTMYESASSVLQLENALNLITFYAVMVLFFIILIGVINTLRMSIRERTREIGTVRAIGMQRVDVRNTFILETAFLTLFAAVTGIIAGFLVMWLLSLINLNLKDNPLAILLVNNHLYFKPTLWGIVSNLVLILFIAVATAYFPARRAAKLSPTTALRHYE